MKVALVNPGVAAALKKENLGIAYLAATLEQTGHETRVIDENAGQDVERELAAFRPDVVGISCMTMYAERAYAIADAVRNKRGVPVILGGAHPTALPDEAIQHADCVIRGEAEWTLPKVLDSGRIEGVVEAVPPADLDALPFPARERLDLDFYAGAGEELAGLPYRTLGVITSRGCPFRCLFCANSTRVAKLRFHSPERVIEEIRFVAERYRIQSIAFYDELMATDQERFCGICHGLIESGLNRLRWECQVHPNAVRADVLPLMKQAGCVQVAIGFESGSQAILDRIGKQATVERNLEVARKVREAGLRLRGCFIMGVPGETVDDIEKTRRFIRDARIDFASMHFLTPYPGTALYLEVADRIAASHIPWSKFTCGDPDTFLCNECIPRDEQKRLFETFSAQLAFHNYSLPDMIRRAIKHPRHALHVAAKLLPWRR